jgi:hypothetical protein
MISSKLNPSLSLNLPQPMTHGYDQKRNHVGVILFIDMGEFHKLILQQMKDCLLSFE